MKAEIRELQDKINRGELPTAKELRQFSHEQLVFRLHNALNIINAQKDHIRILKQTWRIGEEVSHG